MHTPILYRDHIYGIGKAKRGLWTCLDLEGNEVWTSEGKGVVRDGGIHACRRNVLRPRRQDGRPACSRLRTPTTTRNSPASSCSKAPDVWAPPVISQGKLLIRDLGKLVCLNIAAEKPERCRVDRRASLIHKLLPLMKSDHPWDSPTPIP